MGDYWSKSSLKKRSRSLPETGFKNTNVETFAQKMSVRLDEKRFYRSKSFKIEGLEFRGLRAKVEKSLSTSEIPLLVTPQTPRQVISVVKGFDSTTVMWQEVFVSGTKPAENVFGPSRNSGKWNDNVVFTPHVISLLWNQWVKGFEDKIILKDTQKQERTKMFQPHERRSTSTLYQYDTSVTMRY